MEFFKATDGTRWYISVDGGDSFELCAREPFLFDKLSDDVDDIAVVDEQSVPPQELSLSREEVDRRGLIISQVTAKG